TGGGDDDLCAVMDPLRGCRSPCTTLFRSVAEYGTDPVSLVGENFIVRWDVPVAEDEEPVAQSFLEDVQAEAGGELMAPAADDARSEEHTSELQSRFDLVCRLLLEKKKAER